MLRCLKGVVKAGMNGQMPIGIIGGTGPEGRGLAVRFALAGEHVTIGSRDARRGRQAAETLAPHLGGGSGRLEGGANADCARSCQIVVLAVPYKGQTAVLGEIAGDLAGKIVVSVVSPVSVVDGRVRSAPPPAGSAVEEAASLVPAARWVAGFHTLPARDLLRPDRAMNTDALICGDDDEAKKVVSALAAKIPGLRPVDAGPLESARYLEAATALLININRIHKAHASIRIIGI
jgi:NADPH-dependent F420 reductase